MRGIRIGSEGFPAWREGQAVGEWRQIPGTTLQTTLAVTKNAEWTQGGVHGVEGPYAIFNDWNGFAWDREKASVYSIASGGHAGYGGNQTIRLDIRPNAPAWAEITPVTPGPDVIQRSRLYADGRPSSCHTYYMCHFISQRNRAFRFTSNACFGDPVFSSQAVTAINPDIGEYDPDGSWPDNTPGTTFSTAICKHPDTEDVYFWRDSAQGFTFWKWEQVSGNFVSLGNKNRGATRCASAIDNRRGRFFVCGGQSNAPPAYITIASGVITPVTLTGTGAPDVQPEDGAGMDFYLAPDPADDCYFFRKGKAAGPDVYRINAETFDVVPLETTGGSAIPAAVNPIYNRFGFLPQYSGVVHLPNWNSNAWFLRTH